MFAVHLTCLAGSLHSVERDEHSSIRGVGLHPEVEDSTSKRLLAGKY